MLQVCVCMLGSGLHVYVCQVYACFGERSCLIFSAAAAPVVGGEAANAGRI